MNSLQPEQIRARFLHWCAGLTPTQQEWVIQRVLTALLEAATPPHRRHTHTPTTEQARIDATAAQLLADVNLGELA